MFKLPIVKLATVLLIVGAISCSSSDQTTVDTSTPERVLIDTADQPVTPKPTQTATTVPLPTATPALVATSRPAATTAPAPTATTAPAPTATTAPAPTATSAPAPTATSAPAPTATSTPKLPSITALSASDFSTADIRAWTEAAVSSLSVPTPDILGIIYSIGNEIGSTGELGSPFTKYTEARPASELSAIADSVDTWIDTSGCDEDSYRAYENIELKGRLRVWIEGSYDAATARYPCRESRIAIVGAASHQSADVVQRIYVHEIYHTLQQSLWDGCMTFGVNERGYYEPLEQPAIEAKHGAGRWLVEGTADYFSYMINDQINGTTNGIQMMFAAANVAANESKDINSDQAKSGAAAVRLLIERGVITEDEIVSGSIFETCDWVDTFGAALPSVIHAKANWHQFENVGGAWGFKAAALQQ